jgi:hypothetical protein
VKKMVLSKLKELLSYEKLKKEFVQDLQLVAIAAIGIGLLVLFIGLGTNETTKDPDTRKANSVRTWEAK